MFLCMSQMYLDDHNNRPEEVERDGEGEKYSERDRKTF